jgi:TonB family protein
MKFAAVLIALALAASGLANAEAAREVFSEDRDAQPIQPPRPVYPSLAARAGMPGICIVHFDVDTRGNPTNIRPSCTHGIFCKSARDAMISVKFAPKMVGGLPAPRADVVYPIEYRIGDDAADQAMRSAKLEGKVPAPCASDLLY